MVPDPYCSGRHADLVAEDDKLVLTDVGSTNGTFVNGVRLEPNVPREVAAGDEITFGQTAFTVEVA
jgi:pSer/pThr/pTyr-binding forkhead associated (FHA) protein